MYSYDRDYLEIIDSDESNDERYKELRNYLHRRGYGDREQELGFIAKFFSHLFDNQHDIFEIQWQQYQDYNDNWLYFDIHDLVINQYMVVIFSGFDYANNTIWNYDLDYVASTNEAEERANFYQSIAKDYKDLQGYIDKILIFLRALYDYYGRYYFIYVFGRRAKVTISRQGILIDNEHVELRGGAGNDQAFMV